MEIIRGITKTAFKVVVYGPEGIGKSTFASRFPDPLFIDTEGSTDTMDVARLPRPVTWADLIAEVDYVAMGEEPCKTLIIDTADWAERLCIEHVCQNAHVSGIEDIGYGKGYVYVQEAFGQLLDKLEQLTRKGIHVVITAHAMMRKFEQPDELGAYDRWELKLSKKVAPLLKEWADLLLFANYQTHVTTTKEGKKKAVGGERMMYTAHHACWDAKNRVGLPEQLAFSYEEIAHLFERKETAPANPRPQTYTVQPEPEAAPEPSPAAQPKKKQAKAKVTVVPLTEDSEAAPQQRGEDWAGIPEKVAQLMVADSITPEELRSIVAEKGYYTFDTPITHYDPAFLDTFMPTVWTQVRQAILDSRTNEPF